VQQHKADASTARSSLQTCQNELAAVQGQAQWQQEQLKQLQLDLTSKTTALELVVQSAGERVDPLPDKQMLRAKEQAELVAEGLQSQVDSLEQRLVRLETQLQAKDQQLAASEAKQLAQHEQLEVLEDQVHQANLGNIRLGCVLVHASILTLHGCILNLICLQE
jgi:predicted  nucleic acid-binding Zn-ribbon protein